MENQTSLRARSGVVGGKLNSVNGPYAVILGGEGMQRRFDAYTCRRCCWQEYLGSRHRQLRRRRADEHNHDRRHQVGYCWRRFQRNLCWWLRLGEDGNVVDADYGVAGGGQDNSVSGAYGVIIGGQSNAASATCLLFSVGSQMSRPARIRWLRV